MARYFASYIAGPLYPGEYRHLPDGRFRICCAGCGGLFEVGSVEGEDPVPAHRCDLSQVEEDR